MAVVVMVSLITVMGFVLAFLALWQVRPAWFRMRASVGRLISFSVEMDGRKSGPLAVPKSAPSARTGGSE
jgi:hypothetical protein